MKREHFRNLQRRPSIPMKSGHPSRAALLVVRHEDARRQILLAGLAHRVC